MLQISYSLYTFVLYALRVSINCKQWITVKSFNFVGTEIRGLTTGWTCSWTLVFVDFKLYAILIK